MSDGERTEDEEGRDHLVIVRQWKDGVPDGTEVLVRLPGRLGKKDKPMSKYVVVAFYDVKEFKKDGEDRSFFQVRSFFDDRKNVSKVESDKIALELSHLTKDELIEKLGCRSLGDLEVGSLTSLHFLLYYRLDLSLWAKGRINTKH